MGTTSNISQQCWHASMFMPLFIISRTSVCTCVSLASNFTEAPQRIILMCSHQPLFTELMAYIDNMLNTVSLLSVVHRMFNLLFIFLACLIYLPFYLKTTLYFFDISYLVYFYIRRRICILSFV